MLDLNRLLEEVKGEIKRNSSLVDDNLVLKASYFIRKCTINNVDDAFLVFSSFNYLNFAVKQEGYKKLIGYFFKSKLNEPIIKCIDKKLPIKFNLSYDKDMAILYVGFDNFVFSFHNPTLDNELKDKLTDDVDFDNVYKQKAAAFIFKKALQSDCLSIDVSKLAKSKLED